MSSSMSSSKHKGAISLGLAIVILGIMLIGGMAATFYIVTTQQVTPQITVTEKPEHLKVKCRHVTWRRATHQSFVRQ